VKIGEENQSGARMSITRFVRGIKNSQEKFLICEKSVKKEVSRPRIYTY